MIDVNKIESIRAKLNGRNNRFDEDDAGWKTINGTHVEFGEDGNIVNGPQALKDWKSSASAPKETGARACKDFASLSSYMKDTYGVTIESGVSKLQYDAVRRAVGGVEDMMKANPLIAEELKSIGTTKYGVMSSCGTSVDFNPKYYKDDAAVSELEKLCVEKSGNWWPENSSIESIAAHEAAHVLNHSMIYKGFDGPMSTMDYMKAINDWNKGQTAKSIASQACKETKATDYGKGMKNAELKGAVSGYSAKNDAELFAEAHADVYSNGDKANPLSIKIVDITNDIISKY